MERGFPLEADYIIIGVGTAGSVLARRLANKGYSVIGLESGKNQTSNPLLQNPFPPPEGSLDTSHFNEFFQTQGKSILPLAGKVDGLPFVGGDTLGGGSSVNGIQYIRPTAPSTWDPWVEIVGDESFSYENAMEVFNRFENQAPLDLAGCRRGHKGPVDILTGTFNDQLSQKIVDGSTSLEECDNLSVDFPQFTNLNCPGPTEKGIEDGVSLYFDTFQQHNFPVNNRESAATAYLVDVIKQATPCGRIYQSSKCNLDLTIYFEVCVEKVTFEENCTCRKPKANGVVAIVNGEKKKFKARRAVIVCMGFLSPTLLERSGIGNASLLNDLCIPVVYNNSNVGEHLKNHLIISVTGLGNNPSGMANPPNSNPRWIAWGASSGGEEARQFQFIYIPIPVGLVNASLLLDQISEGNVHIQSPDCCRAPIYDFNYFEEQIDLDRAIRSVKEQICLLTNMGYTVPPIPNIKSYVLSNYGQAYHWTGTTRMSKTPDTGVVDTNFQVHGIDNLYVCDTTTSPVAYGGNTASLAFYVSNKLADNLTACKCRNSCK